jgi:hypothetical protein
MVVEEHFEAANGTCSIQFLLHLLMALPINFLHHPLTEFARGASVLFAGGSGTQHYGMVKN